MVTKNTKIRRKRLKPIEWLKIDSIVILVAYLAILHGETGFLGYEYVPLSSKWLQTNPSKSTTNQSF
jgi:hypothetical protein